MKNISKFFLLGAGLLLSLTGCQKGNETEIGEKAIQFNILSGMPETRTQYSGDGVKDASGKLTWERIDWVAGDQVTVWSDNAVGRVTPSKKYATYSVGTPEAVDDGKVSRANAERATEDGLLFDENNKGATYTFWGAYPAFTGAPVANGKAKFSIPGTQTGAATGTGDIVLTPDMSNAAMFGVATAAYGKAFDLPFYPAFSAFEFVIKAAEGVSAPIGLTSVKLISTTALYGSDIEATIVAGTRTNSKGMTIGASTYSAVEATDANKVITFNFPAGTQVNSENTLTFTVFALPQDIVGLNLEFTLSDGSTRLAKLSKNGNAIQFGACAKNRIYTLAIPEGDWHLYLETEVQQWIDASKTIVYGDSGDGGMVISAASLTTVSGGSGSRTAITLNGPTSVLTAYFSLYSPTDGKWRITMKGADAAYFTLASANANSDTASASGDGSYIEGDVNDRVVFTLTPGEGAAGKSVELWYSVVVGGEEYSLHSEITYGGPTVVTCPTE